MRAKLLAYTSIAVDGWEEFDRVGFLPGEDMPCDLLAEFAGRECYQSFHNPGAKNNQQYIKHILDVGHESVLEHSTVTMRIHCSRNTLLELERHRHFSFSVLSTRYVAAGGMTYQLHPSTPIEVIQDGSMEEHWAKSLKLYDRIYNKCRNEGKNLKQAREAARQVLPGNTETSFVITGNLRAWRYMINLRNAEGADLEIQKLAQECLKILKEVAPNSFQDMEI